MTNAELLQLLIRSGTVQASVIHTAFKVLKRLTKRGNTVSYNVFLEVTGPGSARASQIIAVFKLASRYLVSNNQLAIDTKEKARGFLVKLTLAHSPMLV